MNVLLISSIITLVICLITCWIWWQQRQKKEFILMLVGCATIILPILAALTGLATLVMFGYWCFHPH